MEILFGMAVTNYNQTFKKAYNLMWQGLLLGFVEEHLTLSFMKSLVDAPYLSEEKTVN